MKAKLTDDERKIIREWYNVNYVENVFPDHYRVNLETGMPMVSYEHERKCFEETVRGWWVPDSELILFAEPALGLGE